MESNSKEILGDNLSDKPYPSNDDVVENSDPSNTEIKIPILEEQLIVAKQQIEKASVRILKEVSQSEEVVQTAGFDEQVTVVSVPKNIYVDSAPPPVRYEGNTLIIPVLREEVVVVKRLLLVEELHVTKTYTETTDEQTVTLRKESVKVVRNEHDT